MHHESTNKLMVNVVATENMVCVQKMVCELSTRANVAAFNAGVHLLLKGLRQGLHEITHSIPLQNGQM
jgi:hypothetical protein